MASKRLVRGNSALLSMALIIGMSSSSAMAASPEQNDPAITQGDPAITQGDTEAQAAADFSPTPWDHRAPDQPVTPVKIYDTNGNLTGYQAVVDPATLHEYPGATDAQYYTQSSNPGRIWIDKSVFNSQTLPGVSHEGRRIDSYVWNDGYHWDQNATLEGTSGHNGPGVDTLGPNQLSIGVSALGTTRHVYGEDDTPIDVVLVVDFSTSMNQCVGGTSAGLYCNGEDNWQGSRFAAISTAVNEAIGIIAEDNPNNRVAVATFASEAEVLVPLRVPVKMTGEVGDPWTDQYFNISHAGVGRTGGSDLNPIYSGGSGSGSGINFTTDNIRVPGNDVSIAANGDLFATPIHPTAVGGSTNTHLGIATGFQVLANVDNSPECLAADAGICTAWLSADGYVRPRIPNLILFSDGEPTLSSSAPTWWEPDTNTQGTGNPASAITPTQYYGNGFLAALTAAYYRNVVTAKYAPIFAADSPFSPAEQVDLTALARARVFTIGLGLDSLYTQGRQLAYATLDPGQRNITTGGSSGVMGERFMDAWAKYAVGDPADPLVVMVNAPVAPTQSLTASNLAGNVNSTRNIATITHYYQVNSSNTAPDLPPTATAALGSWSETPPSQLTANQRLWRISRIAYSGIGVVATQSATATNISGSVNSVRNIAAITHYYQRNNANTAPTLPANATAALANWSADAPTQLAATQRLWSISRITYQQTGEYSVTLAPDYITATNTLSNGDVVPGYVYNDAFYNPVTTADLVGDFQAIARQIINSAPELPIESASEISREADGEYVDYLGPYMHVTEINRLDYCISDSPDNPESCSVPSTPDLGGPAFPFRYVGKTTVANADGTETDTYHFYGNVKANPLVEQVTPLNPPSGWHDAPFEVTVTRSPDLAVGDVVKVHIPVLLLPIRNTNVYENSDGDPYYMTINASHPFHLFYSIAPKDGVLRHLAGAPLGTTENPATATDITQFEDYLARYTDANGQIKFYANSWANTATPDPFFGTGLNPTTTFVPKMTNGFYRFNDDTVLFTGEKPTPGNRTVITDGGCIATTNGDSICTGKKAKVIDRQGTIEILGTKLTYAEWESLADTDTTTPIWYAVPTYTIDGQTNTLHKSQDIYPTTKAALLAGAEGLLFQAHYGTGTAPVKPDADGYAVALKHLPNYSGRASNLDHAKCATAFDQSENHTGATLVAGVPRGGTPIYTDTATLDWTTISRQPHCAEPINPSADPAGLIPPTSTFARNTAWDATGALTMQHGNNGYLLYDVPTPPETPTVVISDITGSFQTEYAWTITKTVTPAERTVSPGERPTFTYTLAPSATLIGASGHAAVSTITITNPVENSPLDVNDVTVTAEGFALFEGSTHWPGIRTEIEPGETVVLSAHWAGGAVALGQELAITVSVATGDFTEPVSATVALIWSADLATGLGVGRYGILTDKHALEIAPDDADDETPASGSWTPSVEGAVWTTGGWLLDALDFNGSDAPTLSYTRTFTAPTATLTAQSVTEDGLTVVVPGTANGEGATYTHHNVAIVQPFTSLTDIPVVPDAPEVCEQGVALLMGGSGEVVAVPCDDADVAVRTGQSLTIDGEYTLTHAFDWRLAKFPIQMESTDVDSPIDSLNPLGSLRPKLGDAGELLVADQPKYAGADGFAEFWYAAIPNHVVTGTEDDSESGEFWFLAGSIYISNPNDQAIPARAKLNPPSGEGWFINHDEFTCQPGLGWPEGSYYDADGFVVFQAGAGWDNHELTAHCSIPISAMLGFDADFLADLEATATLEWDAGVAKSSSATAVSPGRKAGSGNIDDDARTMDAVHVWDNMASPVANPLLEQPSYGASILGLVDIEGNCTDATATWDKHGQLTGAGDATYFGQCQRVNVLVTDDNGTVVLDANDIPQTQPRWAFIYKLDLPHGYPLAERKHPNTAWLNAVDDPTRKDGTCEHAANRDQLVDCAEVTVLADPLIPSGTLTANHHVSYAWELTKNLASGDQHTKPAQPGVQVEFAYQVVVQATKTDLGVLIDAGQLALTNPNAFAINPQGATIRVASNTIPVPIGTVIPGRDTVGANPLVVAGVPIPGSVVLAAQLNLAGYQAGEQVEITYTEFVADGGMVAYLQTSSYELTELDIAQITLAADSQPQVVQLADVADNLGTPVFDVLAEKYGDLLLDAAELATLPVSDHAWTGAEQFDYTLTFTAPASGSGTYPNHAFLFEPGDLEPSCDTSPENWCDDETVRLVPGTGLIVEPTVLGSYQPVSTFTLTKELAPGQAPQVSEYQVDANGNGYADVRYNVMVGRTVPRDGDWQLGGTIKVTNPNVWDVALTTLAVQTNVAELTCTVLDWPTESSPLDWPSGAASAIILASDVSTFQYTCDTSQLTATPGSVIVTAQATWDDDQAKSGIANPMADGSANLTWIRRSELAGRDRSYYNLNVYDLLDNPEAGGAGPNPAVPGAEAPKFLGQCTYFPAGETVIVPANPDDPSDQPPSGGPYNPSQVRCQTYWTADRAPDGSLVSVRIVNDAGYPVGSGNGNIYEYARRISAPTLPQVLAVHPNIAWLANTPEVPECPVAETGDAALEPDDPWLPAEPGEPGEPGLTPEPQTVGCADVTLTALPPTPAGTLSGERTSGYTWQVFKEIIDRDPAQSPYYAAVGETEIPFEYRVSIETKLGDGDLTATTWSLTLTNPNVFDVRLAGAKIVVDAANSYTFAAGTLPGKNRTLPGAGSEPGTLTIRNLPWAGAYPAGDLTAQLVWGDIAATSGVIAKAAIVQNEVLNRYLNLTDRYAAEIAPVTQGGSGAWTPDAYPGDWILLADDNANVVGEQTTGAWRLAAEDFLSSRDENPQLTYTVWYDAPEPGSEPLAYQNIAWLFQPDGTVPDPDDSCAEGDPWCDAEVVVVVPPDPPCPWPGAELMLDPLCVDPSPVYDYDAALVLSVEAITRDGTLVWSNYANLLGTGSHDAPTRSLLHTAYFRSEQDRHGDWEPSVALADRLIRPGDQLTYDVRLFNQGAEDIRVDQVIFHVPPGLEVLTTDGVNPEWALVQDGQVATWPVSSGPFADGAVIPANETWDAQFHGLHLTTIVTEAAIAPGGNSGHFTAFAEITALSGLACPWDSGLLSGDVRCVEPELCEFDDGLTADHPDCLALASEIAADAALPEPSEAPKENGLAETEGWDDTEDSDDQPPLGNENDDEAELDSEAGLDDEAPVAGDAPLAGGAPPDGGGALDGGAPLDDDALLDSETLDGETLDSDARLDDDAPIDDATESNVWSMLEGQTSLAISQSSAPWHRFPVSGVAWASFLPFADVGKTQIVNIDLPQAAVAADQAVVWLPVDDADSPMAGNNLGIAASNVVKGVNGYVVGAGTSGQMWDHLRHDNMIRNEAGDLDNHDGEHTVVLLAAIGGEDECPPGQQRNAVGECEPPTPIIPPPVPPVPPVPPESCEFDPQLRAGDQGCLPPTDTEVLVCQFNPSLPASHPDCKVPEVCETNNELPKGHPSCYLPIARQTPPSPPGAPFTAVTPIVRNTSIVAPTRMLTRTGTWVVPGLLALSLVAFGGLVLVRSRRVRGH